LAGVDTPAVIVCAPPAVNPEPLGVPEAKTKFDAEEIAFTFSVDPIVELQFKSAVTNKYEVTPEAKAWPPAPNTWFPAPSPVVFVANKVAVPELNVELVENQSFKLVISDAL
jgi:hypothetical protein